MDLIQAWNQVPNGQELTLLDKDGQEIVHLARRGSFSNAVRRLTEFICEEEILSERWRWKV
jgi:hypothetical protein